MNVNANSSEALASTSQYLKACSSAKASLSAKINILTYYFASAHELIMCERQGEVLLRHNARDFEVYRLLIIRSEYNEIMCFHFHRFLEDFRARWLL